MALNTVVALLDEISALSKATAWLHLMMGCWCRSRGGKISQRHH